MSEKKKDENIILLELEFQYISEFTLHTMLGTGVDFSLKTTPPIAVG